MKVERLKDGRQRATIGEMHCHSPVVPKKREDFLNGHVLKKSDQKWQRDYPSEGEISLLTDGEKQELITRELDRREFGCWFYNDGEPTYLTGDHYFFLAHFVLPTGKHPFFRDADQQFYWWWKEIEADDNCIGGVFMGARQRGKTARAAALLLNYATLNPNVWCGISSKTEGDAKDVFQLFVVPGWQNMSALIQPKLPAGDTPATQMVFAAKSRKGATDTGPRKRALNSKIDYRNAKENAYDSKTLARKFTDEPFKDQDYKSDERLRIDSRMMWPQGVAVGKMLLASTVDEQDAFDPVIPEKIWIAADPKKITEAGSTVNGLKRLFMPSYEAMKVDDYGRSLIEESKLLIERRAPADPIERRSYYRANPRTVVDAFATGGKDSIFNLENLEAAKESNRQRFEKDGRYYWQQVDLAWTDDERTTVKTVPNAVNGRFKIVMQALPKELNAVQQAGYHAGPYGQMVRYRPTNGAEYAIGADPYDARTVRDMGAASKGAAYLFWKPDALHERDQFNAHGEERADYWPSDSFLVEYINRPPRPTDFYEDLIKLCHLFGSPILPENNKPGIIAYFEDRGYGDFIQGKISIIASQNDKKNKKKDDTPGMAASTGTTDQWSERISDFTHGPLGDDPRRMPFQHQIQDVATLDVTNTKKFDAAVATGWCLLLARRKVRVATPPPPRADYALSSFFELAPI